MVLLSLVLLQQQMQAQCKFTPDLFPRQDKDRTALEVNANVTVGEWGAEFPGTLIFDIPEGVGTFDIRCQTLAGYKLQVRIEGKRTVSVKQTSLGWATVNYDVPAQTHVIVYLCPDGGTPAPIRVAEAAKEDVGVYIKAIKITPSEVTIPTAI